MTSSSETAASAVDLSDPIAVAKETLADLRTHWRGHLGSALAFHLLMFGIVGVSSSAMFLGMLPGIRAGDDDLILIGTLVGMGVYTLVLTAALLLVIPLCQASLIRATAEQLDGRGTVGFRSSFDRLRDADGRIVRVVVIYALAQILTLFGLLLLYLPGIVASVVGSLAMVIVVLEEEAPLDALGLAWEHVRRHAGWHLVVWIAMLGLLLAAQISIVGMFLVWPLMVTYQTATYRRAFGGMRAREALA